MARRNMVSPDGGVTDESYAVFDGPSGYVLKEGTAPGGGTVTNSGTLNDHEVILGDGAAVVRSLGDVGTSGQVLTSNGAAADPTWEDATGSGNVNAAGALTDHALVLGDGGTDVTVVASLGTATTVLHGAAAGDPTWSAVVEADITLVDSTTDDVSSTKHGFAPKSPGDATKFLNGAATPAFAAVKDSDLSTSDITTNDVSTTKHGFAPKAPNVATQYLDGTGAYSTPSGTGGLTRLTQIVTAASQATVDFTSISGAYSQLKIIWQARDTNATADRTSLRMKVNNDGTSGNYSVTARSGSSNGTAFGSNTSASAAGVEIGFLAESGLTAGFVGQGEITLASYAGTTFRKSVVASTHSAQSGGYIVATMGAEWLSTAAITQLTFSTDGTAFTNGSVFTLYGLS